MLITLDCSATPRQLTGKRLKNEYTWFPLSLLPVYPDERTSSEPVKGATTGHWLAKPTDGHTARLKRTESDCFGPNALTWKIG
jgi:hypothetical protein